MDAWIEVVFAFISGVAVGAVSVVILFHRTKRFLRWYWQAVTAPLTEEERADRQTHSM